MQRSTPSREIIQPRSSVRVLTNDELDHAVERALDAARDAAVRLASLIAQYEGLVTGAAAPERNDAAPFVITSSTGGTGRDAPLGAQGDYGSLR